MTNEEPIEITLEQKLKAERLRRVIDECDDILVIKQIAIELLHINQQKTAIADWSTKKAIQAEKFKFRNATR